MIKTLAIETSCDDTSIWIITFDWQRFEVEKLLAYSQIDDHKQYWWVVPEIASRLHSEKIIAILEKIWLDKIKEVDFITVTAKPWLPWSLMVWVSSAHMLWEFLWKKVVEVDHIEWHIFSIFLERNIDEIEFPMVVLTASGWHNDIYLIELKNNKINPSNININENFKIEKLWQTLDDASWECFDKVARMMWWSYPWWPWISKKASMWKPNKLVEFKRLYLKSDEFNFSFSWVKSKAYYLMEKLKQEKIELTDELINDIAYEFQESVVEVLANKLIKAAVKYWAKTVSLCWWVSANDRLFEYTKEFAEKKGLWDIQIIRPIKKVYSTDNWAMIWLVWIMNFQD